MNESKYTSDLTQLHLHSGTEAGAYNILAVGPGGEGVAGATISLELGNRFYASSCTAEVRITRSDLRHNPKPNPSCTVGEHR